jgi:hypothetical protein
MQGPPLSDTDPEAERVQLELLRAAEPGRRAQMALDLSALVIVLARRGDGCLPSAPVGIRLQLSPPSWRA